MLKVTVTAVEKPAEGESLEPAFKVIYIDDKDAVAWEVFIFLFFHLKWLYLSSRQSMI